MHAYTYQMYEWPGLKNDYAIFTKSKQKLFGFQNIYYYLFLGISEVRQKI